MKESHDPTPTTEFLLKVAPEGWIYQNIAACGKFFFVLSAGYDLEHDSISPKVSNAAVVQLESAARHPSLFTILASATLPNPRRIMGVIGLNQNRVRQAQIACALERFRLVRGEFPQSLDALAPQFIQQIPHDVINDGPLIYRRTDTGYVLYSVGWNEKDDGGAVGLKKSGAIDVEQGDWVWRYPGE